MGVQPAAVIRLAGKLPALRTKPRIVEIRGCNIGAGKHLLDYKRAWGAARVSAPKCRMFYVRIAPHRPARNQTMGGLSGARPITANTRRRFFSYLTIGAAYDSVLDEPSFHCPVDTSYRQKLAVV